MIAKRMLVLLSMSASMTSVQAHAVRATTDTTASGSTSSSVSNSDHDHYVRRTNGNHIDPNPQLPTRRLFKSEQARREIDRIEKSMFPLSHEHVVPYQNHPFETNNMNRELQKETEEKDIFEPMRIHFYTEELEKQRVGATDEVNAKIDFVIDKILPRTAAFWSNALSVVPVEGNLMISSLELNNNEFCGDSEFTAPPNSHFSTGINDTDLILYVSGTPSSRFCSGNTLAVAVACNFDQFDRPIAGSINFCLGQIDDVDTEEAISDSLDVSIHEAAHVLGMSSNSFPYFWDSETGQPRTQRPEGLEKRTVTCVDGVVRTLKLPGKDTMDFFTSDNGQRYAAIVTPKVRAVARNQFDCQSLPGAQLENQPTGVDSCTGDHWDERLFYPEALSGIISVTTNIFSHLTLALMEDSGWYKANFTTGRTDPFGLGAGCNFVTDPCLTPAANSGDAPEIPTYSQDFFCNKENEVGCSAALTHKLACAVSDYNDIIPSNPPPVKFQYFTGSSGKGGPRQADYCPVYSFSHSGKDISELDCTNDKNQRSSPFNLYSEEFSIYSKCFNTNHGASCFRSSCNKEEMKLKIFWRSRVLTCDYDFQKIDVGGIYPTTFTCPRLSQACPDLFCPFNCAGRGVCNFANTENGTTYPKCECFDESDTSAGCSDSLIPDGKFLDDSGGFNFQDGIFDPLISVFVDHPDRWTTSAWGWAIGLFVVFVFMVLWMCSGCFCKRKKKNDVEEPKRAKKSAQLEMPSNGSSIPSRTSSRRAPPANRIARWEQPRRAAPPNRRAPPHQNCEI